MTTADEVLNGIEENAKRQFLPIIGPHKGRILADLVREHKPKRVLEIGTLIGYSAILMARELDESARIVTIENHASEAEIAKENIARAKVCPVIEVIVDDALKVIPTLTCTFDMAFVDAEKTEYFAYLKLMEPKLKAHSLVVADNAGIFADEMEDYLAYVRTSGNYQSRYVQVGDDGLEISIKL